MSDYSIVTDRYINYRLLPDSSPLRSKIRTADEAAYGSRTERGDGVFHRSESYKNTLQAGYIGSGGLKTWLKLSDETREFLNIRQVFINPLQRPISAVVQNGFFPDVRYTIDVDSDGRLVIEKDVLNKLYDSLISLCASNADNSNVRIIIDKDHGDLTFRKIGPTVPTSEAIDIDQTQVVSELGCTKGRHVSDLQSLLPFVSEEEREVIGTWIRDLEVWAE